MPQPADSVRTFHPRVPGLDEVLHASFAAHAYPAHTHDAWTVLLIDAGAVRYDLDGAAHLAPRGSVSILPPGVPHDGRSAASGSGFRKRVLYLAPDWLPARAAVAAAAAPTADAGSVRAVVAVHAALAAPGEEFAAESALAEVRRRLQEHWGTQPMLRRDDPLARRLRDLLDDRLTETFTLAEAGSILNAHPSHLVRAFSRAYGIAPHRYVTGRRVDRARRLLAGGMRPADAAAAVGFHDQAHLSRHFRRVLGATPAAFAPRRAA